VAARDIAATWPPGDTMRVQTDASWLHCSRSADLLAKTTWKLS
jgi:hypothetical protein